MRTNQDLDGKWRVIVDPFDVGYFDYQGAPLHDMPNNGPDHLGFYKDYQPKGPSDRVEYSFEKSETLEVPGDWNSQKEKLFLYEGTVWYYRRFDWADKKPRARAFIRFGAVNYKAEVYLNGKRLGGHEGGYTPFEFEASALIKAKDNCLVVRVNNFRHKDNVPTINSDWWNYGGITRGVSLVTVPETFILDITLYITPKDPGTITFRAALSGSAAGRAVTVEIPEAGIRRTIRADRQGQVEALLPAGGIERWCPEHPRRYRVRVSIPGDRVEETMGFRTIEVKGTEILLNGRKQFLRGICIHEENPIKGGRVTTREEGRMLLKWARELNCNFVRLAHYPHNEEMVRSAEEMGLMVWAEVPVYWSISWENPATYKNAENQLREVIFRDKNRAGVIIWSVANETPRSAPRLRFLNKLAATARRLDPTRLISAALEKHYLASDKMTAVVQDDFAKTVDVVSFNEYIGWYDGQPGKCDKVKWKVPYKKPVIISECGGDALYGHHGPKTMRWTEEFQEELFRKTIAMVEKIPQLRGFTPWILADFRSARRLLPYIQDGWNRKGLVSEKGFRKKAFHVLKAYYEGIKTNRQEIP